jgi:hypothetical protein
MLLLLLPTVLRVLLRLDTAILLLAVFAVLGPQVQLR